MWRQLWRWMSLWERKAVPPSARCECGHSYHMHVAGGGACSGELAPDLQVRQWRKCRCQVFIQNP